MRAAPRLLLLLTAFVAALSGPPATAQAPVQEMEVVARPIDRFRIGSDEARFGTLTFEGGLELRSPARHFGSISGFRFLTPGRDFIGVADTGFWLYGRVERDARGRATGIADYRMSEMVDADGTPFRDKLRADAEGLTVRDGVATVVFERDHRVEEYEIRPEGMGPARAALDFLVPRHELRRNSGFEAIDHAPPDSPLEGARVVVTERSLDPRGNLFAAVLEGPRKGIFLVRRHAPFDVTDGAFLPDGDLLLLERSYSIGTGVAMRLRRIPGGDIRPGNLVDGPVLLEAGMTHQIDNMEALDIWRREDGALIASILSDDNHSLLQRTLYLEFRIDED